MSAEGFRLVIPQYMLDKLDAADKKLEALGARSEKTSTRVTEAFNNMTTNGVQSFINKLSEAQKKLNELDKFKGGDISLGNISIQATQAADDVNKLVDVIAKLYAENEKIKNQQLSSRGITIAQEGQLSKKQSAARYKELQNEEREYMNFQRERERELMRADKNAQRRHIDEMARIKEQIRERQRLTRLTTTPSVISGKQVGTIIGNSNSAVTINQMLTSIKNLEKAKKDLDTTDKNYKKTLAEIDNAINKNKASLRKLGVETENVRKHQSNLMNHAQQLRRALALVFSVSQITGYVNKMIQIRGEFELQQRSLQAILQNKDEANRIWQQTVDLAVRSPFRVKELVTYTKQLAAYRVETDKLHETTRMLSDVSAGLGVDMQRLILAFGQVKAANYLRGTELRQFSEAGINILGELSKYFTELEGRAISVGEVFERVSKRMVSFSDVEEIFKRITSEGGIFYRMQEIQSETVKGLISNLYDQIDLMFNDIGKSNEGLLKGSIAFVKILVENWEVLAEALKGAAAAFLVYKLNAMLAKESTMLLAIDMGILTDVNQKQLKITQLLTLGWKRVAAAVNAFSKTIVSNLWILALTAVVTVVSKLYNAWSEHQEQLDEITKQYRELRKEVSGISVKFTYAKDIDEQKKELNKIIKLAKEKYNIDIDINVNDLDETKVKEQFNIIRNEVLDTMAFIERMKKAIVESDSWWKWGDDIYGAFEEYGSSAQALSTIFRDELDSLVDYLTQTGQLTDELKEAFRDREIYESELDYIRRVSEAYQSVLKMFNATTAEVTKGGYVGMTGNYQRLVKLWGKELYNVIKETSTAIDEFDKAEEKAIREFDEFANDVENTIKNIPEEKRTLKVKTLIDQESLDDFSRNLWYELANKRFSVSIEIALPQPADVTGWRKAYNDYIAKLPKSSEGKSWLNELSMEEDVDKYTNQLKSEYERIDKITAAWYAGNKRALEEYTKEQIIELAKQSNVLKQGYNWLVFTPTKTTGDGGRDIFADQIRVIKEIYQAYKDLGKTLDDIGAKEGAMQKFGNAFKDAFGKTPEQMGFDLFSEEGVKKAYDYLIKNATNAKKKIQAELAKGEIVLETKVRLQQEEDKEFADQIADMFSGYELSLELQKLNIPQDLAQQLFGVETFDLSQIREKLEKEIAEAEKQGGREDFVAERKKELEKVEEMERKAQEERLKTYSKYLIKGMDERVRIKIEELRKLEEVEKDKEKYTSQQLADIRKAIQEETKEALDKQAWEEFKNSDIYISLFEDLEKASDKSLEFMVESLTELRESLNNLQPEQLKEIISQLEKAKKVLDERSPFKKFADDFKTYFENVKQKKETERLVDEGKNDIKYFKQEVDAQNQIVLEYEKRLKKGEKLTKEEQDNLEKARKNVSRNKENIAKTEEALSGYLDILDSIDATRLSMGNQIASWGDNIGKIAGDIGSLTTALENGIGLSDSMADALGMVEGAMSGLSDIAAGIAGFIIGGPMGIIGGAMSIIGGISNIIGSINKIADKGKERRIEREIALLKRLQRVYEELGETIEDTYRIDTLNEATKLSQDNLKAQIAATERMIQAEEDKKKTDHARIEDWKNDIEDMREALIELEETRIEELGGFGSDANKKSGAQAFIDAWMEAYKETGDGLSGLNQQFDEFFEDMVKKQMVQRAANQFLTPFYEEYDKIVDKWGRGDLGAKDAIDAINKLQTQYLPGFNENMKDLAEQMGVDTQYAGSEANLSGLAAGVQGRTEATAEVLASYMNSVRFYVADNNEKFTNLVTRLFDSEGGSNPMLVELKAQTAFLREIRDSFDAVIGRGGNTHSGAYLKVAIG